MQEQNGIPFSACTQYTKATIVSFKKAKEGEITLTDDDFIEACFQRVVLAFVQLIHEDVNYI